MARPRTRASGSRKYEARRATPVPGEARGYFLNMAAVLGELPSAAATT